ncbi:OmpA family protein, partial [Acinetobacter baumannii]
DDIVDPKAYPVVDKIVQPLKALPNSLSVEGHPDAIPIHNARFASNWELSAARGISVLNMLQDKYDIPASRLSVVGYAETRPLASN